MKNSKRDVDELVRSFTGQANNLVINSKVLEFCQCSYEAAALVSQLIYWNDRTHNSEGWIAKTYSDWKEEIFISEYAVRKAVKLLKEIAGVETKVMKFQGSPTVHYRIDLSKFSDSFLEFLKEPTCETQRKESEKPKGSIYTETTSETLTETINIYVRNDFSDYDFLVQDVLRDFLTFDTQNKERQQQLLILLEKIKKKGILSATKNLVIKRKEYYFNVWWDAYQKKTVRGLVLKKWMKIDTNLYPKIFQHTKEYVKATPDKQYRKNPETYINQEAWDSEIIPQKGSNWKKPPEQSIEDKMQKASNVVNGVMAMIYQDDDEN